MLGSRIRNMPARTPKPAQVPALDGVRGLAILAVLLFHNFSIPGGWVGVDLFFALSGFLIFRILTEARRVDEPKEDGAKTYFLRFFARRSLRIFPAYYLLLATLALFDPEVRRWAWWYALYLADFSFARPETDLGPLRHTWSLAVEEQFYLIAPAFVWLSRPALARLTLAILLLVPPVLRCWSFSAGVTTLFANYNIFTRCDALLLGAILGSLAATHGKSAVPDAVWRGAVLGGGTIVAVLAATRQMSITTQPSYVVYGLGLPAVAFASAGLIWGAFASDATSLLCRLLSLSWLRGLGRISYGLYLYHHSILVYAQERLGSPTGLLSRFAFGAAVTAVSIAVALVSWRFFEQPINELKDSRWMRTRLLA